MAASFVAFRILNYSEWNFHLLQITPLFGVYPFLIQQILHISLIFVRFQTTKFVLPQRKSMKTLYIIFTQWTETNMHNKNNLFH